MRAAAEIFLNLQMVRREEAIETQSLRNENNDIVVEGIVDLVARLTAISTSLQI